MIYLDKETLCWDFPLPRTHTGVVMGNGTLGLMVWGTHQLNLTVGRAGFWDRRGGKPFSTGVTFGKLAKMLQDGDEAAILRCFESGKTAPHYPNKPQQVGCGRIELKFATYVPEQALLHFKAGFLEILLRNPAGEEARLRIHIAMEREYAWVELPEVLERELQIQTVPTWSYIERKLKPLACDPPESWGDAEAAGFCQRLPEDPALALAWQRHKNLLVLATALATDISEDPRLRAIASAAVPPCEKTRKANTDWWQQYREDCPSVELPDPVLQRIWDYGIYKQAGLTTPGGVAATLQGPWMEEYQLPPWSNDYHFNINIQMIYWPALISNRLTHFEPLWKMIEGWLPELKQNAERFFECAGALMLPHAVDDRCRVVGTFWTGTIDHACTAWMAQLAWLHYRYSMDRTVLEQVAWPLLTGSFEGYWAMFEHRVVEGRNVLSLPVSVSPEYNGSAMSAWGRDASFQLAAAHFTAQALLEAARILDRPEDLRWRQTLAELPPYSLAPEVEPAEGSVEERRPAPRIGLWSGKDLDTSHRHHSHLGAIYPFRTIDPEDPDHRTIIRNSITHWAWQGTGKWSGWSFGWAPILHARCNNVDTAIALLHWWDEVYCNEGQGTRHDAFLPGISRCGKTVLEEPERNEIMQCDAAMGVVNSIAELLVQTRGMPGAETLVVCPALPRRWKRFRFDKLRTEGAFQVGASVEEGRLTEIRILSLQGGLLRLRHNLGHDYTIDGKPATVELLEVETRPGQEILLRTTSHN